VDQDTLGTLVDAVDGHPDQIIRAANLIISGKSAGAEIRVREVVEALNRSSESLIKLAELTVDQYILLKLFSEFEYMSAEDMTTAFGAPSRFEESLFPLLDYAFVEQVNGLFRLAPSVSRSLSRLADKLADREEFIRMRTAIASRLSKIADEDLVDFEVLENSVAAWVRSNESEPPLLATKLLLPASLLRVARRAYDSRDWAAAAEFAGRALDGGWKLTDEATLEAYRVRGLSMARRDDPEFDSFLSSFGREGRFSGSSSNAAQRHIHFLRGFKARLDGDFKLAKTELEKIIKSERRPSFNVLREYSAVLLKLGELESALTYSRMALEVAGTNPFVISMVIDILDKSSERKGLTAELAAERQKLFDRLKRADESHRTSFSLLREARQFTREGDYSRALGLLDVAEQDRDVDPIVLCLDRASVLLKRGSYDEAIRAAESGLKTARATLGGRAVEYFAQIDEIKIRALVELGRASEAQAVLRDAKRLDDYTREELTRLVGFASVRR
jgi:tetratricopeptide (TPR) repeat protein